MLSIEPTGEVAAVTCRVELTLGPMTRLTLSPKPKRRPSSAMPALCECVSRSRVLERVGFSELLSILF